MQTVFDEMNAAGGKEPAPTTRPMPAGWPSNLSR